MKPRLQLSWSLVAAFVILLGLFVSTLAIFAFDSRAEGDAAVAGRRSLLTAIRQENAGETARLFDVGNGRGLLVETSSVSAVRIGPSRYLCAFACGRYALQGDAVNFPIVSGSTLVAQYPNEDGTYATLDSTTGIYSRTTPATDPAVVAAQGGTPLSPEEVISKGYPELPLQKESCVVITMAELLLLAILAVGIVVAFLHERKRKGAQV